MLLRACIVCGRPSVAGRSRCSTHGRSTPQGPRTHGSDHNRIAKKLKTTRPNICELCGLPPTPSDPLEAGHIIPRINGGATVISNYRLEHRSHNRAEGARLARTRFFPGR